MTDKNGHDFYGGGFNAAVCSRCGQYDQDAYDKPCPGKMVRVLVDRVEHERAVRLAELAMEAHAWGASGTTDASWVDWLRRYEEAVK